MHNRLQGRNGHLEVVQWMHEEQGVGLLGQVLMLAYLRHSGLLAPCTHMHSRHMRYRRTSLAGP